MRGSRTVTILFTDVVGSTALMSALGLDAADELRRRIDDFTRSAIASFEGEEVKHTGDGVMVTFASAADAVGAACAVQQEAARARGRDPRVPHLRVGVATGEATEEDRDWFGPPVVEAARLCAAAHGGQILSTQVVSLLVGSQGGYSFQPLGEQVLKGFDAPVGVVEVEWTAPTAAVPLPGAAAVASSGPHVGRAHVLDALRHAWKRSAEEGKRVVVVGGEPGIGKTRLAGELAAEVHRTGGLVLWGRCDEEVTVGYQPIIDMLRQLLDHLRHDDVEALAPRPDLLRFVPELREHLPGLGDPVAGDPDAERLAAFEAVGELLHAATTQIAPVLLVLDDAHWAPAPTLLLFRHLAEAQVSRPTLVLATYRETELDRGHPLANLLADLRRRDDVDRVKLEGLDEEAVAELVEALAGHHLDEEAKSLAAVVHAETEGNPFFVVQVLRHLAESGAVARSGDRWTSSVPIAELSIPEGVKEVIGRRLSRLPAGSERALAVAAVVGREFDLDAVEQVLDTGDSDDVLDGFDAAVAAGLVDEITGQPGRYRFVHALVRQTLLSELSAARRVRLHRRIGALLAAREGVDPVAVALHLCAGAPSGDARAAVDWSLRALHEANSSLAWEEALAIADRALEVLALSDPPDLASRARVRLGRANAVFLTGNIAGSKSESLLAVRDAEASGDPEVMAQAAIARTTWGQTALADPEGISALHRALVANAGVPAAEAALLANIAFYERVSELKDAEAEEHARQALALARRSGDPNALASALEGMSFILLAGPNVEETIAVTDELEAAVLGSATLYHSSVELPLRTRFVTAIQRADRSTAQTTVDQFARIYAGPQGEAFVSMWEALLALMDGDIERAEAGNGALLAKSAGDVNFVSSWIAQLALIRAEQGRVSDLIPGLEAAVAQTPALVALRALQAYVLCEAGQIEAAGSIFADLAADDFAGVPRDTTWSTALANLSTITAHLGHRQAAAALHPLIRPFDGQLVVVAWGVACAGAASRFLGMLETVLGDFEAADAHFAAAVDLEQRVHAPSLVARTHLWWARSLLPRDRKTALQQLESCLAVAKPLGLLGLVQDAEGLL
jgi:class 3 adenylate cyclase